MRLVIRNRVLFIADLIGWAGTPTVALALIVDGSISGSGYLIHLVAFTVVSVACKLLALLVTGLYKRYWRYASIDELALILVAVLGAGIAAALCYAAIIVGLLPGRALPRAIPVIDTLLTLFFVGGTRFSSRLLERIRQKLQGRIVRERVLIIGAGSAGTMIARELRENPQLGLEPVGFVDDDASKHGNVIHGVQIFGGRQAIPELARDYAVTKVIIAMPRAPGADIRDVSTICERARLQAKIIPGVFDIISGKVNVIALRDVQIEDLLRRPAVETDRRALAELVSGMTVLVSGAGGSIGSEICRQVALLGAAELILLGHGENSVFDIHQEMLAKYPTVRVVPVIADIRNARRIERIMLTYRPQAVFHAAAHKHVPLMELNSEEAVTNNVLGTANMVAASEKAGVTHFVLISTDKAVKPINVMGATKLLAEMLVHEAAERTGNSYVSVRFGNVLASRGSVIPLFQSQIKAGGPITVTHPEMCRYFMTIPEAVELVLQAAALGKGGETFVLDMGEPVKIVDLARDLIHLSGLEVDRDISIVFTGLRPGEKLHEDLFTPAEDVEHTAHQKIFQVRNGKPPLCQHARLDELVAAAETGDLRLRHLLAELVPGYRDGPRAGERPDPKSSDDRIEQPGALRRSGGSSQVR
ncbi:MAG: polysaccharide biosynthesis protein [Gemmatimonadetes bacterium]|nr:polysaccharide biosynthesis protein [Gemmatimonadota bacterium]